MRPPLSSPLRRPVRRRERAGRPGGSTGYPRPYQLRVVIAKSWSCLVLERQGCAVSRQTRPASASPPPGARCTAPPSQTAPQAPEAAHPTPHERLALCYCPPRLVCIRGGITTSPY